MLTTSENASSMGRAWFAVGAPILALVVAAIGTALALVWDFARVQDKAAADASSRLVLSAWTARAEATQSVALDYAFWNEAYLATTAGWDPQWIEDNLFSNLADGLFVVRADGSLRHAWFDASAQAESEAIAAALDDTIRHSINLGALLSAPDKEHMTATNIVVAAGRPLILSAAPISPQVQTIQQARNRDLPVDYLVAVDLVTEAETAELGKSLQLGRMQFVPGILGGPGPDRSFHLLRDSADQFVGYLAWERRRPGSEAFWRHAGPIAGFLLLIGALAVAVARKLVLHQVRASAAVNVAQESSRLKSEFISTMSHELRTPLNAIMGYAELIKEESEDGAQASIVIADAERVIVAAKHLSRLINDVLDQSRVDAGKLEVAIEAVEVAGALRELEEVMAPLAQANANRLIVMADDRASLVRADPVRLQQCLINLVGNALKFTRAGEVVVRARRLLDHNGACICFEIRDNGIGMDKGELDRLFKPFAQGKGVGAKYGGTGLGLSITRAFARAMQGEVTVQSSLGKGTTFQLCLPAASIAEDAPAPELLAA